MSNFLAIATVTAALRRALQASLDVDVPGATVSTVRPDGGTGNTLPTIGANLYLYQATPNAAWRNSDLPTRDARGELVRRPRAALDLHYLISCYGSEGDLESQRVLGSVVRTLHAHPLITREMIDQAIGDATFAGILDNSDLGNEVERVKLNPLSLSLEELSKLWSVFFQTPYTLSVAYLASVVLIEGRATAGPALPVQERRFFTHGSVAAGRTPIVTPDRIPDLALWLRSDRGVSYDSDGLSEWRDARDDGTGTIVPALARQPTVAARPAFRAHGLGTQPVVRFDGSDDYLALDGIGLSAALPAVTVCALVRSDATTPQIVTSFDRDQYWRLALAGASGAPEWDTTGGGATDDLAAPDPLTDGQWHLLCATFEAGAGTEKQLLVDGEIVATAATPHGGSGLGAGATRFGMIGVGSKAASFDGARGPNEFFAGDLAELMIFDRALTVAELDQLGRYVMARAQEAPG